MPTNSTWKKLSEKTVYPGYQTVVQKTFLLPNGTEFTYDIVGGYDTACTVAVTDDNHFLVVEQFRPGPEKMVLEFPAGRVDEGEDPLEAARRELLEETGYVGDIEFLHASIFSAYSPRIRYNYLARNCRQIAEPEVSAGEFVTVKKLTVTEMKELVFSGGNSDVEAGYAALYRLGLLGA